MARAQPPRPSTRTTLSTGIEPRQLIQKTSLHNCSGVQLILVTKDGLHRWATEHVGRCRDRHGWLGPLSLALTFGYPLWTAEFHTFGPIRPEHLETLSVVGMIVSFGWLVRVLIAIFKAPNLDQAIERLIEQAEVVEESTRQLAPGEGQPQVAAELTAGQLPTGESASG
jgi:hypothetical protein